MLQFLVHHFRKRLGLFLTNLLVLKLVVEVVFRLLHIRKAHEELRLDARLLFRLMHSVHELQFIQFLACHGDNTIHFRHHMNRRRILVPSAYLHQVIHVIAEQTRIGRHIRAVTFAQLQFIDLKEVFTGTV